MKRNKEGGLDLTGPEIDYIAVTAILEAMRYRGEPEWRDFPYLSENSWQMVLENVKDRLALLTHMRDKDAEAHGIDSRALLDAAQDDA